MDDLQMLATTLAAPEMSREAVDRGRHRLLNRMRGPVSRRRRPRVLAAMLGLTAAAAAAAVVVTTSGTTAPTATPNSPPAELSSRQILLAAARTAEARPAGSGVYWHVKTIDENKKSTSKPVRGVLETWTRRDGMRWDGWNGRVLTDDGPASPAAFQVAFTKLTSAQLQGLPTTADGLRAWIDDSIKRSKTGRVPLGAERTYVPRTLIELLYEFPAPPRVRAAAYRALAALPDVKSTGVVKGGRGLLINGGTADEQRLVFDPETSLVRSVDTTMGASYHRVTVLAAEWTNTLPKVTPHKTLPPGRG
ncbi:CU044_5270 family protein [Actinoallomurus sp. NPDC050550]|uniref:CU044_5270 family protein n=1 Tax=Actinoallomurus sp. NPDC050550 TaxID=3154937 RepID=UPI003402D89E